MANHNPANCGIQESMDKESLENFAKRFGPGCHNLQNLPKRFAMHQTFFMPKR
jgi:hypothetical protein